MLRLLRGTPALKGKPEDAEPGVRDTLAAAREVAVTLRLKTCCLCPYLSSNAWTGKTVLGVHSGLALKSVPENSYDCLPSDLDIKILILLYKLGYFYFALWLFQVLAKYPWTFYSKTVSCF